MKHYIVATIVSLSTLVACGDLAKAQDFGRGGMYRPGPQAPQGGQQEVRAVLQTAELLAEAVSLSVFDRQRVQQNIRQAQRQIHAVLTQLRGALRARQELAQALNVLQQPRLVLERQAIEGLRYVGRALNVLIVQTGNARQGIRQLSRLTLILAEGSVFDVVAGTAQNLGYTIESARQINPHSKRRMLQAVDQISQVALSHRMHKEEKVRRIEQALDVITNQF